ncbi:MAG: extracellular solute-binding protein [bacterium]
MLKHFLVSILVVMSCLTLSACGTEDTSTRLTVWVNQDSEEITKEMIKEFEALYPETDFNIKLEFVSEADSKTLILQDLDGAADIYSFASDHLVDLKTAGALAQIGGTNKEDVLARDVASSVSAATIDGGLYAYPMTADNGYFMYYDKSVYTTDESLATLDSMIQTAKENNKSVLFDLGNGFYTASFLFANGATMDTESATFDKHVIEALDKYAQIAADATSTNVTGLVDDGEVYVANNLKADGTLSAYVSGTWSASTIQENLGDNYGVMKLPTIIVDGEEKQLASFAGFKYFGVKAGCDNPVEAHALANFLSNEENQLKRFEEQGYGPSNIEVMASDAVQADEALTALGEQLAVAGIPQINVPGLFWDSCSALLASLKSDDKGSYESILQSFNTSIYG